MLIIIAIRTFVRQSRRRGCNVGKHTARVWIKVCVVQPAEPMANTTRSKSLSVSTALHPSSARGPDRRNNSEYTYLIFLVLNPIAKGD